MTKTQVSRITAYEISASCLKALSESNFKDEEFAEKYCQRKNLVTSWILKSNLTSIEERFEERRR